jgi:hypothetical protein
MGFARTQPILRTEEIAACVRMPRDTSVLLRGAFAWRSLPHERIYESASTTIGVAESCCRGATLQGNQKA